MSYCSDEDEIANAFFEQYRKSSAQINDEQAASDRSFQALRDMGEIDSDGESIGDSIDSQMSISELKKKITILQDELASDFADEEEDLPVHELTAARKEVLDFLNNFRLKKDDSRVQFATHISIAPNGSYCVPKDSIPELYHLMNAYSDLSGCPGYRELSIAEMQYPDYLGIGKQTVFSGIMLDFDIYKKTLEPVFNDTRQITQFCNIILTSIYNSVKNVSKSQLDKRDCVLAFSRRPSSPSADDLNRMGYIKDGFHLTIPDIHLQYADKVAVMKQLSVCPELKAFWSTLATVDKDNLIDSNYIDDMSASVPVFFPKFTSKPEKRAYLVFATYSCKKAQRGFSANLVPNSELVQLHSLNGDGVDCKVLAEISQQHKPKKKYSVNRWLQWESEPVRRHKFRNIIPALSTNSIAQLTTLIDRESKIVDQVPLFNLAKEKGQLDMCGYLMCLDLPTCTGYKTWRTIMCVLVCLGEFTDQYWSLFDLWSARAPNYDQVNNLKLWTEACDAQVVFTKAALTNMCRQQNSILLSKVEDAISDKQTLTLVKRMTDMLDGKMGNEGYFTNIDICDVFRSVYDRQYFCNAQGNTEKMSLWYKFVRDRVPGNPSGEMRKWKLYADIPTEMQDIIHYNLRDAAKRCKFEYAAEKMIEDNQIEDEHKRKTAERAHQNICRNLSITIRSLGTDAFMRKCTKSLEFKLRNEQFRKQLNQRPELIGVQNGVLDLNTMELREGEPEDMVSFYAPVTYEPFDPTDKTTIMLLNMLLDLCLHYEYSKFIFIMCWCAKCLSGGVKEQLISYFIGAGANGKSWLLKMLQSVFGKDYATSVSSNFLVSRSKDCEGASPMILTLKDKRFVYISETNHNDVQNGAKMRKIVGGDEMKARALYANDYESFYSQCHFTVVSNHPPIISGNNYADWRRIKLVKFNVRFKTADSYDPSLGEREKKGTENVEQMYKNPKILTKFFSILCYFYKLLQTEYGGLMANVKCSIIEKDTEAYRQQESPFMQFLSEKVYLTNNENDTISLKQLEIAFAAYAKNTCPEKNVPKCIENLLVDCKFESLLLKTHYVTYLTKVKLIDNPLDVGAEEQPLLKCKALEFLPDKSKTCSHEKWANMKAKHIQNIVDTYRQTMY